VAKKRSDPTTQQRSTGEAVPFDPPRSVEPSVFGDAIKTAKSEGINVAHLRSPGEAPWG
jgi:hypothetical protein